MTTDGSLATGGRRLGRAGDPAGSDLRSVLGATYPSEAPRRCEASGSIHTFLPVNGDATVLDVVFDGDPDTWLDASLCDGTADRWRIAQLTAGSFLTAVSARLSARADDRDDVPDPS